MCGLGLEVIYTDDLSSYIQSDFSKKPHERNENNHATKYLDDQQTGLQQFFNPILREYAALLEFIEANINVEMSKSLLETAAPKVTVQCMVGKPIVLKADDTERKTVTCMLCRQEVLRDRISLKFHVQSHSGKRYGCSRCKYHTDRKFDFTRHVRRRHEGEPDLSGEGNRPHWMTMLRSCFPSYIDFAKFRKRTSNEKLDLTEENSNTSCSAVAC